MSKRSLCVPFAWLPDEDLQRKDGPRQGAVRRVEDAGVSRHDARQGGEQNDDLNQ